MTSASETGLRRALGTLTLEPIAVGFDLDGAESFEPLEIEPPGVLVGREDPAVDVRIADPTGTVSRHHCTIEPDRGGWIVCDLNSTAGTRVQFGDEEAIPVPPGAAWPLTHDTRVTFGEVTFRVFIGRTAAQGRTTVTGFGGGEYSRSPLGGKPILVETALHLTEAMRADPRAQPPTVEELSRRLQVVPETVVYRLKLIAEQQPLRHLILRPSSDRSGWLHDIATALMRVYPGMFGPRRSVPPPADE